MSSVHYFQRYTQRENVSTNNTLLLFSRLYNASPKKFRLFLNSLTDEIEINVGVNFSQQDKNIGSIPDGTIFQESFKIAIETKLGDTFSGKQLNNHCAAFKNETTQILLALSPANISEGTKINLQTYITTFNNSKGKSINFLVTTFKHIIAVFRDVITDFDIELQEVIDDYEEFCRMAGLIRTDYRMLTVACGKTLNDNFQFNVYYDPADRGNSYCTHLGIYKDKAVQGVGKIENIITADLLPTGTLKVHNTTHGKITPIQEQNIIGIINSAKAQLGWHIEKNHKFFCVESFEKTKFIKNTKNGLQGKKYFDLEAKLGKTQFTNTAEIAELLKGSSWR